MRRHEMTLEEAFVTITEKNITLLTKEARPHEYFVVPSQRHQGHGKTRAVLDPVWVGTLRGFVRDLLAHSDGSIRVSLLNVVNNGLEALPNPITSPFYLTVFPGGNLSGTMLGHCYLTRARAGDAGSSVLRARSIQSPMSWAKYSQQVLTFLVVLAFSLVNFFLLSQLTNLGSQATSSDSSFCLCFWRHV